MATIENEKVYVTVNADYTHEGIIIPRAIIRKDGSVQDIEDITGALSLSANDPDTDGICYTCWVDGRRTLLHFSEGRWYVEEQVQRMGKC